MSKKGSERYLIFYTFMTILGLLVGIAIFRGISNFLDDTTYWKTFYARDIGMLLDAGITGRGTIDMNYNLDFAKKPLGINLRTDGLDVYDYDPDIKKQNPISFRYAKDSSINIITGIIFAPRVNINIAPDKVEFSEKPSELESCPTFNTTQKPGDVKIYVDSDMPDVKTIIEGGLNIYGFRDAASASEANLTLIVLSTQQPAANFSYYKNPRTADKLRCYIKNSLIKGEFVIFFGEMERIPLDSKWKPALTNAQAGLVIEINGLNTEMERAIIEGVVAYYG